MNRIVIYLLMVAVFFTGTSELVVSGILPILAGQLRVSVAWAGQLVTIYSLSFAIGTPIMISLTARMKRKILMLLTMLVFMIGSLVTLINPSFALLAVSRVVLGVSSGVLTVAAFSAAAKLVPQERIGSAIGTIILGFSVSMILGVPIGIVLTEMFGWQMMFVFLAAGSLLILVAMAILLPEIENDAQLPFGKQFAVLTSPVLLVALLFVLLRETGTSVMYTYLSSFLGSVLHRSSADIGIMMLAIGIAGAVGSRVGGFAVDKWRSARVIMASLIVQTFALALLPLAVHSFPLAVALLALWALSMFVLGPASQTYFIEKEPQSANMIISLSLSVTQIGLAAGAAAGGIAVTTSATVLYNPWVAAAALMMAFAAIIVSIRRSNANDKQPVLS
jgi:DHA1 family putative efflux transporter-like MFS transporter